MRDVQQIATIIRSTLALEFRFFDIKEIQVKEDVDEYGDDILWVDVIYEGAYGNIDISALGGAVGLVRPGLLQIGEEAFPVFSYIAAADAEKRHRAAAPAY